jgi:hypothetical protein
MTGRSALKVYVVETGCNFEGGSAIGVCTTLEKAVAWVHRYLMQARNLPPLSEWVVREPLNTLHRGGKEVYRRSTKFDYISVTQFAVED